MNFFVKSLLLGGSLLVKNVHSLPEYPTVPPSYNTTNPCRCIPGDKCWPNSQEWSRLNATTNGRLIAAAPLASVCHEPNYDEEACTALGEVWQLPETHFPNPVEIMAPDWQGQSCDPFTDKSDACQLGNLVDYTINVSSAADAAAGLRFAQEHNVRLVIKNTGHDYLGKSTGKGALGLWTHNLKSVDFLNYTSSGYAGPAVKIGAGSQAFEVYQAVKEKGLRVVGGDCLTVGLAGGYLQGGGHSALSSQHGLGADNVLEWEVVIANGTLLTASPTENSDLYFALSGGGGGTYGVVMSVTVKAYQEGIVAGAFAQFSKSNASDEAYWKGVEAFHTALPDIVDAGAAVLYSLQNDTFTIVPITLPGATKEDMDALLEPFKSKMEELNVPLSLSTTQFDTYYEHFDNFLGPFPYGLPLVNIIDVSLAGRLIPRTVVENPDTLPGLIEALKLSVYPGGGFVTGGIASKVTHEVAGNDPETNGVNPAWRDSILSLLAFAPWNYTTTVQTTNADSEDYLLDVTVPALTAVAPEGGAYLNEANRRQPDWQQAFYGSNYEKLKAIKKRYDPNDLFFANTAVGSEVWTPDDDGRLCKA